MKISKLPWEVDTRKDEHGVQCAVMFDANGKAIFDAYNSEVICVMEESDEDSFSRWDEQGRLDFEYIAKAVNSHADLLASLKEALRCLEGNQHTPNGAARYERALAAISKAETP